MKTFQSLTHRYEFIDQILSLQQIHLEWGKGKNWEDNGDIDFLTGKWEHEYKKQWLDARTKAFSFTVATDSQTSLPGHKVPEYLQQLALDVDDFLIVTPVWSGS